MVYTCIGIFLINFLLFFKYSCLHFPHPFPPPYPLPPPTLNLNPLWLCLWVLYTWTTLTTLPLLPPVIPFPLPSGYCQSVLYSNVSVYILLTFFGFFFYQALVIGVIQPKIEGNPIICNNMDKFGRHYAK